jgi:hypothetical protein
VADPKQEETFKVIDRRLFTEEGELRKDAIEQERREQEAAGARQAAQAPARKAGPEPVPTLGETKGQPAEEPPASRSFQMLVNFLGQNAAAMLGGMADPRTGQPFVDLEGAREVIDMLDVLRDATRGNLAKADQDLLVDITGSLKLSFMEISKAAADAMAKKAGVKK